MSEITHEWNGTVLTITSDSGTSSMDLKGDKGDDGIRGAQGPAGKDGSSNLKIDDTLSVEGAVADAKAVGDKFEELQEEINSSTSVSSVNGKTGEVTITADDLGAISSSGRNVGNSNIAFGAITNDLIASKAVTADKIADNVIPTKISELTNDAGFKKIYYSSTQPSGWGNGDIWLQPT